METFQGIYRGKKVLVTGHTGFKGAWLCEWLIKLGADVAGFSIDKVSSPSLFEVNSLAKRIKHFEGDVRNLTAVKKVLNDFQPTVVFHLAAQSLVRKSYDEPVATFDTNVMGTVNILEAIRESNTVKAAVLVTTDKCYENVGLESGYRETDPLGGKDPYSASKAACEIVIHSYAKSFLNSSDIKVASARAGNVVGGGDWADDRIVPDCMRAWSKSETMQLRNPESVRPWQHVLEPLSGYLWLGAKLLNKEETAIGEAFNFGPEIDQCKTVKEVVLEMNRHWRRDVPFEQVPSDTTKVEAALLKLNCDKAKTRLQWKPVLDFSDTFLMTVEWYEAFYNQQGEPIPLTQMQISQYEAIALEKEIPWSLN